MLGHKRKEGNPLVFSVRHTSGTPINLKISRNIIDMLNMRKNVKKTKSKISKKIHKAVG